MRSSIEVDAIANAAGATLGLRDEEKGFELPGGCSNNCHSPFMSVIGTVSFPDTIAALPNYGAGRQN